MTRRTASPAATSYSAKRSSYAPPPKNKPKPWERELANAGTLRTTRRQRPHRAGATRTASTEKLGTAPCAGTVIVMESPLHV